MVVFIFYRIFLLTCLSGDVNITTQVCKHKCRFIFTYFAIYVYILYERLLIMSFPDFTRHFFLSLTETVDSFAKGILNQWTHAAKAYCFC